MAIHLSSFDLIVAPAQVLSLTEKSQTKGVDGEPLNSVPLAISELRAPATLLSVKVEDRLSTGSGGSAVVDEEGPQLVDSGESYFPNDDDYPGGCVGTARDGVQSEEDDGSDDGQNYLSGVFEQQNREEGESVGWWVWS